MSEEEAAPSGPRVKKVRRKRVPLKQEEDNPLIPYDDNYRNRGEIGEGARNSVIELPEEGIGGGARNSIMMPQDEEGIGRGARNSIVVPAEEGIGHGARNSVMQGDVMMLPREEGICHGARNSVVLEDGQEITDGGRDSAIIEKVLIDPQENVAMIEGEDETRGGRVMFSESFARPSAVPWENGASAPASGSGSMSRPVKRAHMVLRKTVLATSDTMIEREVLREVIEEDHRRWTGCLMLPVTILFFAFYSAAVSLHEDVTFTHLMGDPIRNAFYDPPVYNLQDIGSKSQVFDFIQNTYIPLMFTQFDSFGRPLPKEKWSNLFQYSRLLGNVEMQLWRSEKKACADEYASHVDCYPGNTITEDSYGRPLSELPALSGGWDYWNASNVNKSVLRCADEGFTVHGCPGDADHNKRRLDYLREEIRPRMPVAGANDPYYRFVLDKEEHVDEIKMRVKYLQDRDWLDIQFTQLNLKAVVFNYQLSVPRVAMATATFFNSRGGGVYTSLRIDGVPLEFFSNPVSYLIDFLFVVMLFITSAFMVYELCKAIRHGEGRAHFTGVNIVTWLTCLIGWGNLMGMQTVESSRGKVKKALEAYLADGSDANSRELHDSMDALLSYVGNLRLVIADAHLLFMCRCFASLQWQPRLAVVTQTLLACSSDLFHYFIVFIPTFMAFAISGMMIFGRQIQDFATLDLAVITCFKIAIEGEFDWHTISHKDSRTATLWVWLFLLLVCMLMLNMILAIIMDVYQEVRMHSGDSMTMGGHLTYLYRKAVHRKQWVSDIQLLDQISEMPQTIVTNELRQAFPEMHHYQLEYLMSQCSNKAQRITRVGINKTYVTQMVAAIHLGLEEVTQNLETMKRKGWIGRGVEVGDGENRKWVKEILACAAVQNHWMAQTAKHISTLQLRMKGMTAEDEANLLKQKKRSAGRSVKVPSSKR